MNIQDVKKKIIEVIKESTETEITLTSETELFADMGLSSVEVVVMLGDLEDAFGIEIPSEDLEQLGTIADVMKYIESHQ